MRQTSRDVTNSAEANAARALGDRLRQARQQKKWSRSRVARAVRIDPSWLYKIETGRHWPSWHLAAHLADLLDVPRSDVEALFAKLTPPIAELRRELAGAEPLAAVGARDPIVPIIALVESALADVRNGLALLRGQDERVGPGTVPDPVLVRHLATRCDALLLRGKFEYFYQLVQRSELEILTIEGIGRKTLRALRENLLAPMHLSLGMTLDEWTLIAVCQEILRNAKTETP